jgi:hypothetical protein
MITRRFKSLPEPTRLPPRIVALDGEARKLTGRRSDAITERADLEDAAPAATAADRQAAADAIRAGKPAVSAGTPAQDQLDADRAKLDAEIDALNIAVADIETDMAEAFATMAANPKTSGYAAACKARDRYAAALAAMRTARAEFHEAAALAAFIRAGAGGDDLPDEPTDAKGWPVANPQWLRVVAARIDAHKGDWNRSRGLGVPVVKLQRTNGSRDYDVRLTGDELLDLLTPETETP